MKKWEEVRIGLSKKHQDTLITLKGLKSATANELAFEMHKKGYIPEFSRSCIHPRLTELINLGLVEVKYKRRCRISARSCVIYAVKDVYIPHYLLKRNRVVDVKRGEVYFAYLSEDTQGSEQGGERPVIILQNDIGNKFSPTIIVGLFTTKNKKDLPTHFKMSESMTSTLMLEQIKTIDKSRLGRQYGTVTDEEMTIIDKKLQQSLGLLPFDKNN